MNLNLRVLLVVTFFVLLQRSSQAVVVAVSSQAVFDSETEPDPGLPDLLKKGPAFSFIEVIGYRYQNNTIQLQDSRRTRPLGYIGAGGVPKYVIHQKL